MKTAIPSTAKDAQSPASSSHRALPSPYSGRPAQLVAMMNQSPRVQAQLKLRDEIQNSEPVQKQLALAPEINQAPVAQPRRREEEEPAQREATPNRTGLPDQLKSGVESLSGISLDDVKVHYNSARPAQLNALAYAQGTDIHVAPGQEKHLPHEAWHVVQQKQGRVQLTAQMKGGVHINNDKALEHEADAVGAKLLPRPGAEGFAPDTVEAPSTQAEAPVQRVIIRGQEKGEYFDDSTEIDYAFITQDPSGKQLLFASREELRTVRDQILAESSWPEASEEHVIRDALQTWVKFDSDSPSKKVDEALRKVSFVLVEEDKETPGTYDDYGKYLKEKIVAVLGGAPDSWGRLTFKKPGFGERAPVANGKVYLNRDKAADKNGVAAFLGIEVSEVEEDGRFAAVEFESLADAQFKQKLIEAGTDAISAPGQKENFFYVSAATRIHKTTTATEGNYVLNKRKYVKTSGIPKTDEDINKSYNKLKKTRALQDWAKVDRVGMRAGTQDQAMEGWNALGMAAYANSVLGRDLKLDQDYEWLHIRGVQNGGRNLVENLGTGTWIANSQMIPFENQIRNWADKKPGSIEARYETTTNPANSPVLDKITIKVAASANHEIGPVTKADPLKVEFDAQSGLLADSFTNKVQIKSFGDSAVELKVYQQGLTDAKTNQLAHVNPKRAQAHADYLLGAQQAQSGLAAGPSLGEREGHGDYLAGVVAAQASQAAGNRGHTAGHTDYLAGVAAAQGGLAAGTGGHASGHADYLAGVAAAQTNQAAGNHGHAAGHTDYLAGVAAAQGGLAAGTGGHASGHADYLAGVAAAQANQAAGNRGHAAGHADYLTGVAAAQNGLGAGAGGHATGHADYRNGYVQGERNAFFFAVTYGEQTGYQDGVQRFNAKNAKSRKFSQI
jgi:hypothetical protein